MKCVFPHHPKTFLFSNVFAFAFLSISFYLLIVLRCPSCCTIYLYPLFLLSLLPTKGLSNRISAFPFLANQPNNNRRPYQLPHLIISMTISSSQIATCRNTIYEMSPTLLPENIAGLITTASLATRVSLRCSSLVIDALFEGAKYGTSVSLGLGRNALTSAISTARLIHSPRPELDNADQYGDSASDRYVHHGSKHICMYTN